MIKNINSTEVQKLTIKASLLTSALVLSDLLDIILGLFNI